MNQYEEVIENIRRESIKNTNTDTRLTLLAALEALIQLTSQIRELNRQIERDAVSREELTRQIEQDAAARYELTQQLSLQNQQHALQNQQLNKKVDRLLAYAYNAKETQDRTLNRTDEIYNALVSCHSRSVAYPKSNKKQPGFTILDVSDIPSERRKYDKENKWLYVFKIVKGQKDIHVKSTVSELVDAGAKVIHEFKDYANGIPFREQVKYALHPWMESRLATGATTRSQTQTAYDSIAAFIKIAAFGLNPNNIITYNRFKSLFSDVYHHTRQLPVQPWDRYNLSLDPVPSFL